MTPEVIQRVAGGAISALLGVFIGWGGTALTLGGRVDAIEAGQLRVELLLHTVLAARINAEPFKVDEPNSGRPHRKQRQDAP